MTTITREEAIIIASEFSLEEEVLLLIDKSGYTPAEALLEWDLI